MKALKLTTLGLVLVAFVAYGATSWSIDKSHSKIGFEVTHMKISNVDGKFDSYEGTIKSTDDDFENAEIMIKIDVNSINTGIEKRDNHLKSDDFFDSEKFPYITFKSKKLKRVKGDEYKLIGDLTIRDVTKEIELDAEYKGEVKDPYGNMRSGWEVEGEIDRFDYGLEWNAAIEAGGLVVSREVDLDCDVELIRQ